MMCQRGLRKRTEQSQNRQSFCCQKEMGDVRTPILNSLLHHCTIHWSIATELKRKTRLFPSFSILAVSIPLTDTLLINIHYTTQPEVSISIYSTNNICGTLTPSANYTIGPISRLEFRGDPAGNTRVKQCHSIHIVRLTRSSHDSSNWESQFGLKQCVLIQLPVFWTHRFIYFILCYRTSSAANPALCRHLFPFLFFCNSPLAPPPGKQLV